MIINDNIMTKTKIELSNHYHEILEMIKDNKTPKFISNYLEDNYNEKISVPSIYRFKKNRYNKLVVAEADRIRKNEVVDNTDIVVNVEDDIINTVANQFNKVLELNSKALLIIDNIFNSILDKKYVDDHDLKLYRNAFKIVELSSKYSFKQYLEVNIQQDEYISVEDAMLKVKNIFKGMRENYILEKELKNKNEKINK